jgi:hypothetical protein
MALKINLFFKENKLKNDPECTEWLKTCENVINEQMEKDGVELISVDLISEKEIRYTTKRIPPS